MTNKSPSVDPKAQTGKPADTTRRQLLTAGTLAGGALLLGGTQAGSAAWS